MPNGSWNLVATSPGVTLTPGSFMNPVQVLGMSQGNLNFQVTAGASFTIEGTVRTGGTALPNVSVTDGTRTAKTDSLGHYVFVGVAAGLYTLTPTLAGYTFVPATVTSIPWKSTFNASSLTDGTHLLTARATDAAGNATTSDPVSITVGVLAVDTTAPAVTVIRPSSDATTGLQVDVSVEASDDVGVTDVKLALDGTVVATLGSTPWLRTLEVAAGAHTLVAIATDAAGNSGRSLVVSFTAAGATSEVTEPEPVLGGCGCTSVDGPACQLALLLVGFALRSRKR